MIKKYTVPVSHKYDFKYKTWKEEVHSVIMLLPILVLCCLVYVLTSNEVNSPRFVLAIILLVAGIQQGWMVLVNHYTCYAKGRDRVVVSSDSILYFKAGREKIEIKWEDISSIKYISYLQKLEIDAQKGKSISIGYQIQNFSSLEQCIADRVRRFGIISSNLTFFSKSLWVKARQFIGLLTLLIVNLNIYFNPTVIWFDILVCIISVGIAWRVISSIRSITIEGDYLSLNKLLWDRVIKFSDIGKIEYCDNYSENGFSNEPYVLLEVVKKGQSPSRIELEDYKEGLLALGESLRESRNRWQYTL